MYELSFPLTIEGFLAIAAKHIVLHLLGRLGAIFSREKRTEDREIPGTEEGIERPWHEVAMMQGYAFRKAQAAVIDLHGHPPRW